MSINIIIYSNFSGSRYQTVYPNIHCAIIFYKIKGNEYLLHSCTFGVACYGTLFIPENRTATVNNMFTSPSVDLFGYNATIIHQCTPMMCTKFPKPISFQEFFRVEVVYALMQSQKQTQKQTQH